MIQAADDVTPGLDGAHCRHVAIGRRRLATAPEGAAETYFAWITRPNGDPPAVWPGPIVGCRPPHRQGAGADGDVEGVVGAANLLSTVRSERRAGLILP